MALAEVVVIPLGTGSPSVSKYVARAVKSLKSETCLKYESTSMGTILEGDLDLILSAIRRMHESAFDQDVMRVETLVRIDDRRDKPLTMKDKLASLKGKLQ